ncbi:Transmembrane protein [Orchesella cincta]|uniref:Transmembrane protein n=1 Tax=Orchesella cincta TaxID=48709 RepID=A0A1D2NJ54_ORCCI|nr:Transmembrane protein [Orchesella cincta]
MYSAAVGVVDNVYGGEDGGSVVESFQASNNVTNYVWMLKYVDVDIDYARWLGWLFTPVLAMFILPSVILILLYLSALFLYIYKWHRHRLLDAYERDFWEGGRKSLAALWDAQGWLWHGFEVVGLDNIPEDGPALIVFYHGAIPIDFYYVLSKCILFKGRLIRCVGDRFLFQVPGWSLLMEAFKVLPGTVQSCASILKDGNVLAIAPGGVFEAQFGNSSYQLLWKNRVGFAKVALEAKVPIIPMFTQNIREAFRSFSWGMRFWRWLYAKTHLPLVPIYGFFPVKMKTYIGKPIPYDPNNTPEMLAQQAAHAIENLIKEHQRVPGSVFHALIERFYKKEVSKSA